MTETLYTVEVEGTKDCLWRYRTPDKQIDISISPPIFEVDGEEVPAVLQRVENDKAPVDLPNGTTEYVYSGALATVPDLSLELVFRIAPSNPILRYRYRLKSKASHALTKGSSRDNLRYMGVSLGNLPSCKEVRFSEFDESIHSYRLVENDLAQRLFDNELSVMGPMLVAGNDDCTLLTAYEHGSQVPDAFLQYCLSRDRYVTLRARKGNYLNGQPLDSDHSYETVWMQFAAVQGNEEMMATFYRAFVLKHLTLNTESRKPYIFYNTWNYQERNKWWNGKKYLDSMNQERILAEIDIAYRMGIDVFVIDTGWYEKTGDWCVDTRRFDENLKTVKAKLDGYGMKLGLWFSPTQAAVSSGLRNKHKDCIMSWQGQESKPGRVWETEESQNMCLVSRYWEAFADELIRLVRDIGVTYFKWDAVSQYGCDSSNHWHGNETNRPEERAASYAFQLGQAMCRVVDKLCTACPEAIVDFDITEGGRFVGLGFLSVGKYFLINNGPYYYASYNIPRSVAPPWSNVFVYPGPARGWICRTPLDFDKWIPSVLFLTHYLPDDPEESQLINIGSLILGQNGIWGDLPGVSQKGVELLGQLLRLYKQVRDDITESFPVRTGIVSGSPEIYEKISAATGKGVVVIFASAPGKYTYVTKNVVAKEQWSVKDMDISFDEGGRARIDARFDKTGAKIVFFGVHDEG